MFVLQPKPTFKATAAIPIPGGGEGNIEFVFKHMGRKALREYVERMAQSLDDVTSLLEIVADWNGVDEKFSKEALETLIDAYPGAATAIFVAYNKAMIEGKVKN